MTFDPIWLLVSLIPGGVGFVLIVYGVGVGFATAQLTGVVLADVPVERSGQGSGTQSTARQVGSALGIAVLGTVLFLQCERRGYYVLAGAAAVLLAIKPHIVYLFWFALLLWAIQRRRWALLAGGIATGFGRVRLGP